MKHSVLLSSYHATIQHCKYYLYQITNTTVKHFSKILMTFKEVGLKLYMYIYIYIYIYIHTVLIFPVQQNDDTVYLVR